MVWIGSVKEKIAAFITALFLVLSYTIGKMMETNGGLEFSDNKPWLLVLVVTPILATLLLLFFGAFRYFLDKKTYKKNKIDNKKWFFYTFFFFMICWGIVLAGVYPGFFVYDAGDELLEVITRQFTTHHPLFHVLFLGGIIQAVYKVSGDYNLGICAYMVIQSLLFCSGLSYVIVRILSLGVPKKMCQLIIVFWGLFPVIPMMVLCSCKDSLFSLILILWVVDYKYYMKFGQKKQVFLLGIWSILLMLLRNNAVYAFVAAGIIVYFIAKWLRKEMIIFLVITIVAAIGINQGLAVLFHASSHEYQEILTVPIQQIARVYQSEKEVFSEDELSTLNSYLPKEALEKYRDKLSDPVKISFNNVLFEKNKGDFMKIWFIGLKKAPVTYLNAWFMTSYGYWYPEASVDVYRGNQVYTFTYQDSSYFGYETEQPGFRDSKVPIIDDFYRNISLKNDKDKIPVVKQLFSMGCMVWIFVIAIFGLYVFGGSRRIIPYILVGMVLFTLLLGPTYLPRYVFFLWLCVPVMIGDSLM